jgi:outer membrane receptor protein involved in Fe transport
VDNGDGREKNRSHSVIVGLTSVFRPTLLNQFRFQFSRDDATTDNTNPGVPDISIFGFDLGTQTFVPRFTKEDRWQVRDDFTWIRGRHNVQFGADIVTTFDDNFFPGTFSGSYSFLGFGNWIELSRTPGGRDFFGIDTGLGQGPRPVTAPQFTLNNYQQRFGGTTTEQTTVDYGFYIQDTFRIHPRFTIYAGLRYEFQQLEDPILPNTAVCIDAVAFTPISLSPGATCPGINPTAIINQDENNFAPRIGLAWSPRENLVVRAGYGIFYIRTAQLDVDNALKNNNTFSFNQFLTGTQANAAGLLAFNPAALDPTNFQDSDFPNLAAPTTACPAPPFCTDPFASVNFFAPDRKNGYTQQGSIEVQWEFYPQHSITAGFIRTQGTNLPRNRNINVRPAPVAFRTFTFEGIGPVEVPDYNAGSAANRPDPNFSALNINESGASSAYTAFTLAFERRWHRGLVAGATYTLSKNVTDIANGFSSSGTFFSDIFDQNNARLDRGQSRLDERHYFITRLVWEPDFWRDAQGAARWALDGWSWGFIYNWSSGRAVTPVTDADINRDNARTAFGDGDRVPFLGRGTFRLQGRNNFDLSIYKRFRIDESKSLQFRFQAYNLFNRTFFTRQDDVLFNVSGLTATLNENFLEPEGNARRNRDIQFGLVFRF